MTAAWFSSLGTPLGAGERDELRGYLAALGMRADMPLRAVQTWKEAGAICREPSEEWWRAEEAERARLEGAAHLDPADPDWLALNEELYRAAVAAARNAGCADPALIYAAAGAASYAAYHARLATAAAAPASHPFARKYALYRAGRWPLGVYEERFAIF